MREGGSLMEGFACSINSEARLLERNVEFEIDMVNTSPFNARHDEYDGPGFQCTRSCKSMLYSWRTLLNHNL